MSSEWNARTFGDFVTIQRGHDLPDQNRRKGSVPILGSFGITGYHDTAKAKGPGVTIGRSGASFGVAAYSGVDYWPLNTALYVTDFKGNDPQFVFYFMKAFDFSSYNSGSAQPSLNRNNLYPTPVRVPQPREQKQIASLLAALDDRIALLRETNTTLEAIAQALFKSWFVDFDPVRAKQEGREPEGMDAATAALFPSEFEDSELGNTPSVGRVSPTGVTRQIRDEASDGNVGLRCANPIYRLGLVPRGWQVGKVESLIELAYGKALKASDRLSGNIPVYGSGGITGYHNEPLVMGPSIVVGRKGTVGTLYWEDQPFFPIDTVFYVKAKTPLTYCFYQLNVLGLEGMNTDGAVPGLNRNNVYRLPVIIPSKSAIDAFDAIVLLLRKRIFANVAQAQTLATLRDTLLPRLISGQLRLPDTEAILEAANA